MRTTIRMDDDLLREVKQLAAKTDRTLTAVIEDALREMLARQATTRKPGKVSLPTVSGKGVHPGVDLDNTGALLDLMDRVNGPN